MTDNQTEEIETAIWDIKISVEEYSEIAEAIGQIALTWNNIHDVLSQVFARGTGLDRDVAYAIWNAIKSDRTQRQILSAATKEASRGKRHCVVTDKIIRLVQDLDSFSGKRNSAVHCPFTVIIDLDSEEAKLKVIPNNLSKNDSAEKLRNVDVLAELQNRDSKLERLKDCARDILDHT